MINWLKQKIYQWKVSETLKFSWKKGSYAVCENGEFWIRDRGSFGSSLKSLALTVHTNDFHPQTVKIRTRNRFSGYRKADASERKQIKKQLENSCEALTLTQENDKE